MIEVPCGATAVLRPDRPAAHRVELALDHDEGPALADGRPGPVQVEEQVALREDRRLGGVDVFRLAGRIVLRGQRGLPRGEGDDAALVVADRDHEPAPEAGPQRRPP